jgi:hypothetical protein
MISEPNSSATRLTTSDIRRCRRRQAVVLRRTPKCTLVNDPIVSIRDNSDIDPRRIRDVLAWAARALITATLSESAG